MEEIISKNRRNATEVSGEIRVFPATKEGRYFFTNGDTVGYVSAKTAEAIIDGELKRRDLQIADVSVDGGATFVTCLMKAGREALAVL